MTKEIRAIKIEYHSGKTSPPIDIEILSGPTDVEIQFAEPMKKGRKRFSTDGAYVIGANREEAWEQFKKLLSKKILNQDPEKIYIV